MPINSFLYPAPSLPPAYSVANSCLFNRADGPNMTKTPGSSGNLRKWTWSCWVKRGTISNGSQTMFNAGSSSNTQIRFDSDDTINFYQYSSSYTARLATNAKYRDPSAWMHVVAHWDTDNSTAGDRMKLFVNGTEVTSFAADVNPALNLDSYWNASGTAMYVGDKGDGAEEMDGYLAEVVFIDGQNLAPTSFGEFDEDSPNIWKPIDVSGLTFGTNGFYLDFEDSSNLGNDKNGGTDLTENNIAATDQMIDTCTNNFCTMNPLTGSASGYAMAYSQGNLHVDGDQSWSNSMGTFGVTAGKWYWEIENFTYEHTQVGIASPDIDWGSAGVQDLTGTTLYYNSAGGEVRKDGSMTTADYGTFGTNDVLGIALNMDDGQITFYKNGSAIVSKYAISTSITTAVPLIAISGDYTIDINFGSPAIAITSGNADANGYGSFEYSVPSGYYSLCTQNLAKYGG